MSMFFNDYFIMVVIENMSKLSVGELLSGTDYVHYYVTTLQRNILFLFSDP
jgi:hypothetical protein